MKKLMLKQHQHEENTFVYRVMQVVNATKPKINAVLSEAEVANYCKNAQWVVTIKGE